MSYINIETVKADLRVTHDSDDTILQVYLDAAEDEVKRYLNRDQLPTIPLEYPPEYNSDSEIVSEEIPSTDDPVAPSIYAAVFLMVRAMYDAEKADEIAKLRQCAETLMQPYRAEMGV